MNLSVHIHEKYKQRQIFLKDLEQVFKKLTTLFR